MTYPSNPLIFASHLVVGTAGARIVQIPRQTRAIGASATRGAIPPALLPAARRAFLPLPPALGQPLRAQLIEGS